VVEVVSTSVVASGQEGEAMSATFRLVAAAVAFLFVPAGLVGSAVADPLHGPASRRVDNPFRNAFENAFAETVEFAGDIDGDGDDELLVALRSGINRGRVALYLGSPAGIRPLRSSCRRRRTASPSA
jgi:hypothetical protein